MAARARRPAPCGAGPYVGPLVLIAFAGMSLQVVAMGYGQMLLDLPTYWILAGTGLLMMVQVRRSQVARGTIIAVSVLGASLYFPGLSHEHGLTLMFVAFLTQALAMSSPPVRRHVEGFTPLPPAPPGGSYDF